MKTLLLTIVLLTFSTISIANSPFGPVKVRSVGVSDAGFLVVNIQADGQRKHTEQCDSGRENQLIIPPGHKFEKEMFSIALAAKSSDRSITGWVNGCHAFWSYKSPKLTVIVLSD